MFSNQIVINNVRGVCMMLIEEYQEAVDKDSVLSLSGRLVDFELPARIDQVDFERLQYQMLKDTLNYLDKKTTILLIKENGNLLGFIELQTEVDWISHKKQGYISRIIVDKQTQGKGIGKKLMLEAEKWAANHHYERIGLNVFLANERAYKFYQQLGYEVETIKMSKSIE